MVSSDHNTGLLFGGVSPRKAKQGSQAIQMKELWTRISTEVNFLSHLHSLPLTAQPLREINMYEAEER